MDNALLNTLFKCEIFRLTFSLQKYFVQGIISQDMQVTVILF